MASEIGFSLPTSPHSTFSNDADHSPAKPLMRDILNPALKRGRWIIHPYHPQYILWDYVINALVFWSSFSAPYIWAMMPNPTLEWCIYEAVVGVLFAADMVIRTGFLAYIEKEKYQLVEDRKKIAFR